MGTRTWAPGLRARIASGRPRASSPKTSQSPGEKRASHTERAWAVWLVRKCMRSSGIFSSATSSSNDSQGAACTLSQESGPALRRSLSVMRKPSGATRWSRAPVTAQRRATLPVLGGIWGWTRTTCSGRTSGRTKRPARSKGTPSPPPDGRGCADPLPSVSGACMQGLSIIANPKAHRNRLWPLAAQSLRRAAPGALLLETRNAEELALAVARIAREKPPVLAIAGGDGTVQHTLTALDRALGPDLPALSLLGGGAYDSLSALSGRGGPEDKLRRLSEALESGTELKTTERDTLRAAGQCGFRLGVGLPVRFVEAIYATGHAGPLVG